MNRRTPPNRPAIHRGFRPPSGAERAAPTNDRRGGLPTVPSGALRTRWTRYVSQGGLDVPIPVNINCWRATLYFSDPAALNPVWDGIQMRPIFLNVTTGTPIVVQIGGAMYDNRPVYINEVHQFAGYAAELLVVEEFYDGAIRPNN